MNKMISWIALMVIGFLATPAFAGSHANPCNPCAMKQQINPCNPCAMKKHANPCAKNPCAMKKHANPCAMNPCSMKKPANPCSKNPCSMNPCSSSQNTPIRPKAFNNFRDAAALGKKMWNDESLGSSGMSCASCHSDYELLKLGKNRNFPHYVGMVDDVVTLDQMINYCMVNPMKGKQFEKNSKELTAMGAYYRAYRMQYMREHRR